MHYYQFHIGDYISHTIHLSLEEDLAYRRLLDMYYDTEQPIPNNIPLVSRRLRLGSDVVQSVLDEFFTLSDDGYKNHRADLEIREYHAFIDKQRNNGKLGGRPKKTQRKPTANPSQTQKKPNQQPLTINHKPIKEGTHVPVFEGFPVDTWLAFIDMRKKLKKPMTDHAMDLMIGKLQKMKTAGQDVKAVLEQSITKSWSDVYDVKQQHQSYNKYDVAHITTPTPPNQDAALRKIEEDLKNIKPPSLEVLAKMAQLRKSMA
jgi:uncharacterized protein YdaU (DUF1376 family)